MRRLALLLPILAILASSPAGAAGRTMQRNFNLTGFRQVDLRASDNVIVRAGPVFSVRATGPEAALKQLTAEVRGDTLRVGRLGNSWSRDKTGIATVTVTLPTLTGASVSGSGDMTVEPFTGTQFAGAVAGSGDLRLVRIAAVQVVLSVAGSGDLVAAGRAARATLSIAGSGNLDARAMATTTLSASVAGSGDLQARAVGTASTSIVGSGDITVHGPARCTVSKVGSGDVRCNAG